MDLTTAHYQETKKCLRATGPAEFELIETHLLYLNPVAAHNYTVAKESERYQKGFHEEIRGVIDENVSVLVQDAGLELVDLGPGAYPDKTEPLILEAAHRRLKIAYVPVDVSAYYLTQVEHAVRELVPWLKFASLQVKFEDLHAADLDKLGLVKPYVFLGPTYMNFQPDEVVALVAKMLTPNATAIVATELITSTNTTDVMTAAYTGTEVVDFAFGALRNLRCEQQNYSSKVSFNETHKRIEYVFTCRTADHIFAADDKISTAVSYRTTLQEFDCRLAKRFSRRDIKLSASGNTAVAFCGL